MSLVYRLEQQAIKTRDWEPLRKFYLPKTIRFILIGNQTPSGGERHFYYGNVPHHDNLFINVMRALAPRRASVYTTRRTPEGKRELLEGFRAIGGYVMEVYPLHKDTTNEIHSCVLKLKEIEHALPNTTDEIIFISVHNVADRVVDFLDSKGFRTAKLYFPLRGNREFFIKGLKDMINAEII